MGDQRTKKMKETKNENKRDREPTDLGGGERGVQRGKSREKEKELF